MGLLSVMTDIIWGPFRYRVGPDNLGIGVNNLALVVNGQGVNYSNVGRQNDIRAQMDVLSPNVLTYQVLPDFDLRQSGLFISGNWSMEGFVDAANKGQPIKDGRSNG